MVQSFVKFVDCEVKNKGEILIYTLNKTPLFFTGCKLRPRGIEIEATACQMSNIMWCLYLFC